MKYNHDVYCEFFSEIVNFTKEKDFDNNKTYNT